MNKFISKKGEIQTEEHWRESLNKFWKIFESPENSSFAHRLPKRPADAWERFVSVLGLTKVD